MGQENTEKGAAKLGIFFQPLGGCNQDDVGSNCSKLTHGWLDADGLHGECVLIGLGGHPVRRGPDGPTQQAPDILDLLDPKSPQTLRAIFLPHAHGDDDDGILRYLEHGYKLPPLYGSELTLNIQKEKLQGRIHRSAWPEMHVMPPGQEVEIGSFKAEAVPMGHTLPSSGFVIKTGGKGFFFTGDFKLDQTMLTQKTDLERLTRMGNDKEIDVLFLDSTRASKGGAPVPEVDVREALKAAADRHPHHRINIVVETGNAEAIARTAWLAADGKRVLVHHGSQIEHRLRALNKSGMDLPTLTDSENLIVTSGPTQLAGKLSPSYVLNMLAGVNGEPSSVFSRICRGTYEHFQAGPQDVFIISSSVKPWNATSLEENIRLLKGLGVEHVYRDGPGQAPLDSRGHEHGDGQKQVQELVQPRSAIVAVHGSAEQRDACRQLFNDLGEKPVPMVVDNGTILGITHAEAKLVGHEQRELALIPVRPAPEVTRKQSELKAA